MNNVTGVPADEATDPQDGAFSARPAVTGTLGRERAIEAFVATHYPRLIGLAGLVCGEVGAAEDIVQAALERAWRSRGALREDASLGPWLDRIVVREAAREQRWRLAWLGRLFRPPTVSEIPDLGFDLVDREATGFPDRAALRSVFDQLSPAHRAVVVLHLHRGYTVDETAELLGIPRETAKSRLRVARERLRIALEGGD
jgi:RNA polymerase sigma-70 factor (ECF subfamily)